MAKSYRGVDFFFWAIVVACHLLMVSYIPADIAGRSFLSSGIPGSVEIGEFMMVLIGFLGLARAHKLGAHVDVDLLFNRLPVRIQEGLRLIVLFILICFAALFFYATLLAAVDYTGRGEDAWFGSYLVPVWFLRWVAPVGLAFFIIQLVIDLVARLRPREGKGCSQGSTNESIA